MSTKEIPNLKSLLAFLLFQILREVAVLTSNRLWTKKSKRKKAKEPQSQNNK
jgi:hypothetical protein